MDPAPRASLPVLCNICAHFVLERFKVANGWCEGWRCLHAMRHAGERTECILYCREPGSDGG